MTTMPPFHRALLARCLLLALALGPAARPAAAQALRDPTWQQWLEQDRHAELEAAARQRLKAEPADPQASVALGYALLGRGQPADADAAVPAVEACVRQHPRAGECQHMLGLLLGSQALRGGMLKAMRLAGRVREAFEQAVALAPEQFIHRSSLMQYYVLAPAIAGGGKDKARELLRQTQARDAGQGRALQAMLEMADDRPDEAERLLWPLLGGADPQLRSSAYQQLGQIGAGLLQKKDMAASRRVFERLAEQDPTRALAFFGLGWLKMEAGAPQDALRHFGQARGLRGQASLPLDYREALAWLALGDSGRAKPLLQRFIAAGRGVPQQLEDARERLARLD